MAGGRSAVYANQIIQQGTLTIGAATTKLVAGSVPCSCVWIGAASDADNSAIAYIGADATDNESGGRPIQPGDLSGFMLPIADAGSLYVTGANGDEVEFQIYG